MFLLEDTKNGEPRHVPMPPKVRASDKVAPRNKWNVFNDWFPQRILPQASAGNIQKWLIR
ncbi:hypothetical protein [Achromobacter sp. Bel]|uniref:hypothetical protein n=1 Tax=Achromobacter sp. Bel TaxID=2727415 RepID=UPI00145CCA7B|nr:hypothetical protein [Achromobacter sp. Bel]